MVSVHVWVDANHPPVVELNVSSRKPIQASVSIEPWRRVHRKINNTNELDSAFRLINLYPFFQFLV